MKRMKRKLFLSFLFLFAVANVAEAEAPKPNEYGDVVPGIGATADEVPCGVMKRNETIRFAWTEMVGVDHYRYSLKDLKSGRYVKSVRTKNLQGFLPKKLNDKQTTYRLKIEGIDGYEDVVETRVQHFHIERKVIQPTGKMNYKPEITLDDEFLIATHYPGGHYVSKDDKRVTEAELAELY